MKWLIVLLALLQFGFMTFDGTRALMLGDYIRPDTGSHAGQLGPWSYLARAIGVDPEGTLMKWIFVLLGTAGLTAAMAFLFDRPRSRWLLLVLNIVSLWYLVIGTVSALVQVILLSQIKHSKANPAR